jgi:hypothetical protein
MSTFGVSSQTIISAFIDQVSTCGRVQPHLIPGYYGSRGLNMILDYVIREVSEPLLERSVNDGLTLASTFKKLASKILRSWVVVARINTARRGKL